MTPSHNHYVRGRISGQARAIIAAVLDGPGGHRPAAIDAESINEANDLMEVSREQLEVMRRQADRPSSRPSA